MCGLTIRVGLFLFLGAVAAQTIQNAALALQGLSLIHICGQMDEKRLVALLASIARAAQKIRM